MRLEYLVKERTAFAVRVHSSESSFREYYLKMRGFTLAAGWFSSLIVFSRFLNKKEHLVRERTTYSPRLQRRCRSSASTSSTDVRGSVRRTRFRNCSITPHDARSASECEVELGSASKIDFNEFDQGQHRRSMGIELKVLLVQLALLEDVGEVHVELLLHARCRAVEHPRRRIVAWGDVGDPRDALHAVKC
jgi:hypothetical protein